MRKSFRRFNIRFRIGNRFGRGSIYNLRDIAISLVDKYSLTETELWMIVELQPKQVFNNPDMSIERLQ